MGIASKPVVGAVSLCAALLCAWIVFISFSNPPVDPRVAVVALSRSGRWLAAGNAQGRITVWDQTHPDSFKQFAFPHGALNDLRFSPDEQALAIASKDLALYAPAGAPAPQLLRSDHANYGGVRFSRDGQDLLVTTGAGVIETIDAHSGAVGLKVCCSTIYGEAVYTPDGQQIANAGHWPRLWDARSGQLIARLTANRQFATFRPIAFDATRGSILMGSQDGRVYAWDLHTKQRIAVSPPQPTYVDTLGVSPTGWVIFAGFGKQVQLWNPATGHHRTLPAAHPTSNLVPSPDGAAILFGTAGGAVESWDLKTEQRLSATKIPGT